MRDPAAERDRETRQGASAPPEEHADLGPQSEVEELDFHAEDVLDKPFDRRLALRLLGYVLPYRRLIVVSLGLILLSTALSLVTPIFVKEAVDGPLAGAGERRVSALFSPLVELFGIEGAADEGTRLGRWLMVIVGVYALALMFQFLARYAQTIVMNLTGQNVMRDLRLEVFGHLQRQSVAYYQEHPVGRLVTRVTSDVEALNELFTSGVVNLLGDVLTLLGIVALMFYYDPDLALLALSVSPFLVAVTALFRTMARRHYREIRRRVSFLNSFTQESIIGLDIIQIFRREDARAGGYEHINEGYLDAFLRSIFWYAIFFPAVEILSVVALALVIYHSGHQIALGNMAVGEFFLFWIYLTKFFQPVRDLAEKYNILQAAMASAERIFGVLDEDSAFENGPEKVRSPLESTIRFENVSFAYDPAKPVLRDVSFEVRRGETLALVGATGAGKSTVVNLLMRFYDPGRGRILVDGRDIRELDLASHRRRFGLVLQDVSIFTRKLSDNIDLDRGLPVEKLKSAAEEVHASGFIDRLNGGFDEPMRERGSALSSGERQLLSFARALAGDPEILVLDEATSHIDSETEAIIQAALARLVTGRTSLIIAHRLSTIRSADRILVFHHGELREEGPHRELLAHDGIYARLYRLQFAGHTR